MKKLKFLLLLIPFLFIGTISASEPNLSNLSFQGLGVNNALLNCSASGTNCYWDDYDFTLSSLGSNQSYSVGAYPIVPIGWTFNLYNAGVFISGYVYTIDIIVYDNTSSLEYYRNWSYAFTTGYDSYSTTNAYAEILQTRVSRAGNNFTISIDFKAKDWFRYLRVNARAPFNSSSDKVYADTTYIEQDIVYNSLKRSGTYTFGFQNYSLSYVPDYEYVNIEQNTTIINQNNQTNEELNNINGSINDMNDSITNDDSSEATDSASSFFSDFTTDTFGLSSIVSAPLSLIESITSNSCTPLTIPIPFVNKNFSLPCMTTIYSNFFGDFLTIYQTITFGIVAYWICVRFFALVKDFKNPEHDEIEVLDL